MKERPIPFTGEMVQAILGGQKTHTRRLRGLELINAHHYGKLLCDWALSRFISFESGILKFDLQTDVDDRKIFEFKCPYGQPGDRLWVRETYSKSLCGANIYKADFNPHHPFMPKWKPSIFMPKGASRITLEILNVRVERLQEISEEDAVKEGVNKETWGLNYLYGISTPTEDATYKKGFANLWDSINGKKYPWVSNPWVWVIEFKKL